MYSEGFAAHVPPEFVGNKDDRLIRLFIYLICQKLTTIKMQRLMLFLKLRDPGISEIMDDLYLLISQNYPH